VGIVANFRPLVRFHHPLHHHDNVPKVLDKNALHMPSPNKIVALVCELEIR
jgi:hypothetical protein